VLVGFRDFFSTLPLISQVDPYHFYINGYTESLKLFSDVRVILNEEWLGGLPFDLQDHVYKVNFPCYFVPIFRGSDCYGFVVKGFTKSTPRFCTNFFLPGCEKIQGHEVVILVEGFKDAYLPMLACKDLPVVVLPMLTAVPSKELLCFLHSMNCSVVFISDNDAHRHNHVARFFELCGKEGIKASRFDTFEIEDFGDFFNSACRLKALEEAGSLRGWVKKMLSS